MKAKKMLALLLSLVLMISFLPMTVLASEDSVTQSWGENIEWTLTKDGELTFTGTGVLVTSLDGVMTPWLTLQQEDFCQIQSITISPGITEIGDLAFRESTALTNVSIPEGVTSIGLSSFSMCESLETIEFPSTLTTLGDSMFTLSGIKSLVIPEGVTEIPADFAGSCSNLTTITFPSTIKKICFNAFYNCTALENIVIPEGVETIEFTAFAKCSNLKTVTIPVSLKEIQWEAFNNTQLTDIYYNGTEEQWNQMIVGENDGIWDSATVHFADTEDDTISWPVCVECGGTLQINFHQEPSCDMPGRVANYYCPTCDLHFDEETHSKVLDTIEYGEPTGCDYLVADAKAPTCTEAGNLAYRYCKNSYMWGEMEVICQNKFITIDGEEESRLAVPDRESVIAEAVILATGHSLKAVAAVDATFTTTGSKAHWACTGCETLFSDEAGTNVTTKEALVIPQRIEVSDGKAEVKEEAIDEAIENAGTSNTVTLPLTETKEETSGATLPVASLEKIAETDKSLSVETGYASVTIDNAALESIVTSAGTDEEITLEVVAIAEEKLNSAQKEAIKSKDVAVVISAEIICGDANISDFGGGKVTVKIPFTPASGTNGADYAIIYVDDEGGMEEIETKYESGCLVAALEHFSEYAVVNTKVVVPDPTPTPPSAPSVTFSDVSAGSYYYDAVNWAIGNNVTYGIGGGKFAPDQACTRGQVVTFLWRAAGCPAPSSTTNPFVDVSSTAYYYEAVLWAAEQGITVGVGDGKFAPNATCTRAQIVTFLWRAMGEPAPVGGSNPFGDVAADAYYTDAVLWAVENDITYGVAAGSFAPNDTCNRGQVVTFLYRTYN